MNQLRTWGWMQPLARSVFCREGIEPLLTLYLVTPTWLPQMLLDCIMQANTFWIDVYVRSAFHVVMEGSTHVGCLSAVILVPKLN